MSLDREKELPPIPVDVNASATVVEDSGLEADLSSESPMHVDTHGSSNVDNTLSEQEIRQLHELWNGAGLSARAHRRRRHDHAPASRRIPAPISIPNHENVSSTSVVPSTGSSTTSIAPGTGTRKRLGFFSTRPFSETQEAGNKVPNTLEKLRAIAQDRLKRKLRYAKSAPNLGDTVTALERGVNPQPAVSISIEAAVLGPTPTRGPRNLAVAQPWTAIPEANLQQADLDKNGIYFTINPNWRASQDSVQFECITPIPDSFTSLGRPDSPLLHRHYSLDQLSFEAQQTTRSSMATEVARLSRYSRDEVLHPIDELHAFLEL